MSSRTLLTSVVALSFAFTLLPCAFAQMPNPYGPPISVEIAKKLARPAIAEAVKNHLTVAVAIVDPNGALMYYEKMDNTQLASADAAIDKARTSALYKRPSKALQDALAKGGDGLRVLALRGATAIEGGFPIVLDGKIVGAIGVSGDASAHDSQCAEAALATLK
ncbi:MAG TPA: heme-binding protein [Candidatus Koribacter sp.]|jgi:uncharacterized protein GlcG (DUF336 family)